LRLDVSSGFVVAFATVALATLVCLSWRWSYILGGLSKPVPARLTILTLYRSAAHSLAVLVPSGKLGGDPLRVWLASRAGIPAANSIASTVVDRSLEMGASAPFSIVFAMLLLQHGVPQLEQVLVSVVVGTAALMLGAVVALRRLRRGAGLVSALVRSTGADRWPVVGSRMNVIEDSERATATLARDGRRMIVSFAIGLLANLLVIAEFALLLHAFGLPADGTAVVAAIFATGAAHMFPVPAGVGVLEGAQMWLFEALGHSPDVGLAVGLAVRLRELLWMAPGLTYLLVVKVARWRESGTPAR
jgi:uncharacterized protein (TIRG00374 family)